MSNYVFWTDQTRWECPYCGVLKSPSKFAMDWDGCLDCDGERRDCPYHVRLHPDEKCTCPRRIHREIKA